MSASPQRSCVGCRSKRPQAEVIRLCFSADGEISPDLARQGRGRGAYLCPNFSCVEQATRRGGFARSAKRSVQVPEARTLARAIAAAFEQDAARLAAQSDRAQGAWVEAGGAFGPVRGEVRAAIIRARLQWARDLLVEAARPRNEKGSGPKKHARSGSPLAPEGAKDES